MKGVKMEHIRNILFCFALSIIWLIVVTVFFHWLYHTPYTALIHKLKLKGQLDDDDATLQSSFFYYCISAPLWEEWVYRVLPIKIAQNLGRDTIIPIIIASSIIFGLGHGALYNIYIQGVLGLLSSYLYIKNNNSYWSSVCLHFLYNFFLVYGLYIIIS